MTSERNDEQLLEAIGSLYATLDPPPTDLAAGALARLAVEDLENEYELLTLVERVDLTAGVRGMVTEGENATVALEFAGSSFQVLVRISTVGDHRRIDGWVVPAVPMTVRIGHRGRAVPRTGQSVRADGSGRFAFDTPASGETRLWLLPDLEESAAPLLPFVTPPFLV